MESSDFIISNLKVWEKIFPKIQIKYAYDDKTEYHIVEIGPHKLYEGNKDYIQKEEEFWESFYENFPEEDLCISEFNDLHDMSNLLYSVN